MARNEKHIVYGSVAGNFKGGFEWKITNSIEDAIQRNATDIEVVMWGSQPGNYTSFDLDSKTSYYKLTVGGLTETVNIKTKTDWREGTEEGKIYYAGNSYPLMVSSGTAVATFTINHNTDGTAPVVKLETKWSANAGTFQGITTNATLDIPTIPRTTTPVVSPTTQACGSNITIDLSKRASDSFTHTLSYRLGGASGVIINKTAVTSYTWTIPASLASQFASVGTSQTLAIICDTYQGNTLIGSTQVYITATLPSEYAPAITINSVTNLVGNNRFLQGVDGVSLNFTVGLKSGASDIKTAVLKIDGLTYTLQSPDATANLTIRSQVISSSGTLAYTLTVTDNRGMSTEVTNTVVFTAYSSPSITLYAKRDSNNPATVNITGSVSHNLAFTCYIEYRVRNTASWATLATLSSTNNNLSISLSTELLLQAQAWEVRARVVDSTYGIVTERVAYVTAVVTYSEKRGGRAAAFFGSATEVEDGTLKIFGNLEVTGTYPGGGGGGGGAYSPGTGIDISAAGVISVKDGTYFPYTGGNLNGVINITGAGENPYVGLFDGVNYWYYQALQEDGQCGIGKTWTVSFKVDDSGNASVVGNLLVSGNTITNGTESVEISDIASKSEIEDMLTQINNALSGI